MRSALLGTAAAGALLLGYGRRAYAACTPSGVAPNATLTCTGDISGDLVNGGLDVDGTVYDTLDVYTLSAPITPNAGTNGINFDTSGDITITSDATINATNAAIFARAYGSVTITSSGDLTSSISYGIQVYNYGSGDTYVRNDGAITSFGTGISVRAYGSVTVSNYGVVNVTGSGYGIGVRAYSGDDIKIYNYADVTGGNAGIFTETSGSVTIISTGDVTASGTAIAVGGSGSMATLSSGTVYGNRFGVQLGSNATLNNSASLSGGVSAVYGGANATVNNSGTITGNVNYSGYGVGGGTISAFNNNNGATFNSGHTVSLGADTNVLTNSGALSPGGTGSVQTTALTGSLVQTATGNFIVDIDQGGAGADSVTITGTADFAGTVTPNVINISSASGSLVIATAAALTSTAVAIDTGGFDFSLSVQANQLLLSWARSEILNLLVGANANQRAIAAYLDAANAAGASTDLQVLINALLGLGGTDLLAALNQLLPEIYSDAQIAALYASLGFANNLLSCKVNGTSTAAIIGEGQCLWAGANATFLDQGSTFSNLGFTDTTGSFAAGVQFALDPVWRLGFGAGYQQSSLSTAINDSSESDTAQAGVALKYNSGPLLVAGVVSGGRGWYDTTRPVSFTGFSGMAESSSTIDVLNGGLRIAYVFGSPQLYIKPTLDAAATRLDMGAFSETGGGAANLNVMSSKQTVYTIAPSVEMGTEWWLANGTLIRPFLRAGATFYEGNDFALSATFLGAPVGVTPFTIHTEMDDLMGTIGAGLDMVTAGDTVLHLSYDGQLGNTTKIHSVGLKGSVSF